MARRGGCRSGNTGGIIGFILILISGSMVIRGVLMVASYDEDEHEKSQKIMAICILTGGLVMFIAAFVIFIVAMIKYKNRTNTSVATTTTGATAITVVNPNYRTQYGSQNPGYNQGYPQNVQPLNRGGRPPPANRNGPYPPPYPPPNQNAQYPPVQSAYPPPNNYPPANQNPPFLNPAYAPPPYSSPTNDPAYPPSSNTMYNNNYSEAPPPPSAPPSYDVVTTGDPFKKE